MSKEESDIRNTLLVANLMILNGIDLNSRILEVSEKSTGSDSLTKIFSNGNRNCTLLSREFDEKEASKLGITGYNGKLYSPFGNVGIKTNLGVNVPSIDEFDTVVVNGYSNDLMLLPGLKQDIYAGYAVDRNNKKLPELREAYRVLYGILNYKKFKGYLMIEEQYKRLNKEVCLIARKK